MIIKNEILLCANEKLTLYESVTWVTKKCLSSILNCINTKWAEIRENILAFCWDKQNCTLVGGVCTVCRESPVL